MNDEIKYFLDVEDTEDEDDNSTENSSTAKPNKTHKIVAVLIVAIVFLATAFFGMKVQKSRTEIYNETTEKAEITTVKTSDELNISDTYKIKTLNAFTEDNDLLRGQLNINKEDLTEFSSDKLSEMFNYLYNESSYAWITVNFGDGTGLFTLPGNNNTYLYGLITENGLISNLLGTVIFDYDNGYCYIPADTDNSRKSDVSDIVVSEDNTTVSADIQEEAGSLVYVTASGTKYHLGSCSYLTKSKIEISLSKAISQGYEPCSRCIK